MLLLAVAVINKLALMSKTDNGRREKNFATKPKMSMGCQNSTRLNGIHRAKLI